MYLCSVDFYNTNIELFVMRRYVEHTIVIAVVLLSVMSDVAQPNVAHGYEFTYETD